MTIARRLRKYTAKELKTQPKGFIFSFERFVATLFPSNWAERRAVNSSGEATEAVAQAAATMERMQIAPKGTIIDSVKKWVFNYGTGLSNNGTSKKLPAGQNSIKNTIETIPVFENAQRQSKIQVGRRFIWLPSSAKEPRDSHLLRYGKVFEVGSGVLPADDDFPGKVYGCKCGYQWVDDAPSNYDVQDEASVNQKRTPKRKTK